MGKSSAGRNGTGNTSTGKNGTGKTSTGKNGTGKNSAGNNSAGNNTVAADATATPGPGCRRIGRTGHGSSLAPSGVGDEDGGPYVDILQQDSRCTPRRPWEQPGVRRRRPGALLPL
ncbi:hypothetical protein [Arthrobacter pityocampae]|uniref:hypothetical protein n=1 Tax=Arthrobacter pityocampae TaxID=547334 RepID=UPI00373545F5